jgi:hypothetical protein
MLLLAFRRGDLLGTERQLAVEFGRLNFQFSGAFCKFLFGLSITRRSYLAL